MKKRYLYSLLFGIPGFFVSGMIAMVVFGAVAGILWIYIFGDNPWPSSTQIVLSAVLVLTFLILWIALIVAGYITGKKLENDPLLNWKHILVSGGFTLLFILFIVFQQWNVGNIGPKSDSLLCNDFCTQKGFSGSGMPSIDSGERNCSCFDSSGNEALKVPLDGIDPDALK